MVTWLTVPSSKVLFGRPGWIRSIRSLTARIAASGFSP